MIAKIDEDFARSYNVDSSLDHGALVPLYFINKEYKDFQLVHITYGLLSPIQLYKFGNILKKINRIRGRCSINSQWRFIS